MGDHLIAGIQLDYQGNAQAVADCLDVLGLDDEFIIHTHPNTAHWHIFFGISIPSLSKSTFSTLLHLSNSSDVQKIDIEKFRDEMTTCAPLAESRLAHLHMIWREDPEVEALVSQLGLDLADQPSLFLIKELEITPAPSKAPSRPHAP